MRFLFSLAARQPRRFCGLASVKDNGAGLKVCGVCCNVLVLGNDSVISWKLLQAPLHVLKQRVLTVNDGLQCCSHGLLVVDNVGPGPNGPGPAQEEWTVSCPQCVA